MDEIEFSNASSSLASNHINQEASQFFERLCAKPRLARDFVARLAREHCQSATFDEHAIRTTLASFERLAESAPSTACILMLHLWKHANDLYMHDACDAIDNWIHECKTSAFQQHLLAAIDEERDAALRNSYSHWLQDGNTSKNY